MNKVLSYMTLVTLKKSSSGLIITIVYIISMIIFFIFLIIFCLLVGFIIKKIKKLVDKK